MPAGSTQGVANRSFERRLSSRQFDFVREHEGGCAVGKLHQVHVPFQVEHFAHNDWGFAESAAPTAVPNRPAQATGFANYLQASGSGSGGWVHGPITSEKPKAGFVPASSGRNCRLLPSTPAEFLPDA